ncbi:hypothetical protein BS47DRAFT_1379977 [Hydnum rufescens UP504]|uniref:NUC153 domain-containing protein n=1 Tax=Hydnum rufescens UP504 TaxID=1448309 RepID=A0A9P6E1C0_9AGAM|nr:hypothetical protein BS47DRAFT_1379977 [Hydnum rufescens UP504]
MRGSHADALKGGTADLLSILDRGDSRPWGFSYTDVKHPVKVDGAGDERLHNQDHQGEGHGLLTNADVVVDVLESIPNESYEGPVDKGVTGKEKEKYALNDRGVTQLFENPEFQVDETSREHVLLNPAAVHPSTTTLMFLHCLPK